MQTVGLVKAGNFDYVLEVTRASAFVKVRRRPKMQTLGEAELRVRDWDYLKRIP